MSSVVTVMLYFLACLLSIVALASAQCGCSSFDKQQGPKPDEKTGLYEGDMDLTPENVKELQGARNVVRNLWPNGTVYYKVSQGDAKQIRDALMNIMFETALCVTFIEWTGQSADYVDVINGDGCYSSVGRRGGRQVLSLKWFECYVMGTIQHEFLHALGFYHEHSRRDRDEAIDIHWENIDNRMCHNFYKSGYIPEGFPGYDIRSVMHYGSKAFSCNNERTITSKSGGNVGWGKLSPMDVKKIKELYKCNLIG